MNLFFVSDTHFGHKNIIKYCNRPFRDVDEMDEAMIRNWNSTVGHSDVVIHLGDVGFTKKLRSIVSRLNGKKILIRGNHDNRTSDRKFLEMGFVDIQKEPFDYMGFVLSHYPVGSVMYRHLKDVPLDGKINLYGHVHNGTEFDILRDSPNHLCLCVEHTRYRPVSIDEVRQMAALQRNDYWNRTYALLKGV